MSFLSKKLFGGDSRSSLVKKNIAGSFLIKGWSGLVQLLIVPISLDCLTPYEYGLWLTINSFLIALSYMDIGLGNGLRNKLAEAMAQGDRQKARALVSTTFLMLFLIVVPIVLLGAGLIYRADVYGLMNVSATLIPNLPDILFLSFAMTGATFIFKFIGNVYLGMQLPAVNNLINVAGLTVAMLALLVLSWFGRSSLLVVAAIYTASPLLVYLLAYPVTFGWKYPFLAPRLRLFSKAYLGDLFSLGILFFVVQIAGIVLFQSSNIIISKMFSPEEVTPYQVSYRYYTILSMITAVISSPLWAATTDAYTKADFAWMRRTERKLRKVLLACLALLVAMTLFAPVFYRLWVGDKVAVPSALNMMMALYTFILACSSCYSNLIFGTGKIRLIVILTVLEAVLYIPLAVFLGGKMGVYGVLFALILVTPICAVANFIQFQKIAGQRAHGIWGK